MLDIKIYVLMLSLKRERKEGRKKGRKKGRKDGNISRSEMTTCGTQACFDDDRLVGVVGVEEQRAAKRVFLALRRQDALRDVAAAAGLGRVDHATGQEQERGHQHDGQERRMGGAPQNSLR